MTMEAPVLEAPAVPAPAPAEVPAPAPAVPETPAEKYVDFDEADFSSLAPEVRKGVVDPLLTKVQMKVKERLEKERETFKPHQQKAEALEKLIAQPWFQKAYYEFQNPKAAPSPSEVPTAPKPAVSADEWNRAYEQAAQGDLTALNSLQEKQLDNLVQQKYAPILQQVQNQTRELKMSMEMNDIFTNHPDVKELDSLRVDPANPKSPSLFELSLHYISDKKGGSFEDAYQAARRIADQMKAQAKSAAMGLVQEKKAAITEKPSQSTGSEESVVMVNTPQEALKQQIMASLKGQNVTYRVRPR